MATEETKHDLLLKRIQVSVAILAGLATLIVGVYNVKKSVFGDQGPGQVRVIVRSSEDRQTVSGAYLEVYNSQNALVNAAETQSGGEYVRGDLDAGSYIVKVSKAGFEPQAITAQVNPKKTTELEIILKSIPAPVVVVKEQPASQAPSPIRSALEEAGASWIRSLAKPAADSSDTKQSGEKT